MRLRLTGRVAAAGPLAAAVVVCTLLASVLPGAAEEGSRYWIPDGPTRRSLPLAPAAASPVANVERDCGPSAEFRDGVALWVFCDSLVQEGAAVTDFVNNSAALATPAAPLVMQDRLSSTGKLVQFIEPVPTYAPCTPSEHHFIWPTALTVVPEGPVDRALIFFMNLCGATDGGFPTPKSIGLAELRYTPGAPSLRSHAPLRATVVTPHLFSVDASPHLIFGEQALHWYGYVYVYRCGILSPRYGCQVARAPAASAGTRSAYRYFVNGTWSESPSELDGWLSSPANYPLGGGEVRWMPRQQVFAMVWVDEAFGWSEISIQTAPQPTGPWQLAMKVQLDGDCNAVTSRCYAATVHPHLGNSHEVVLGYMDTSHTFVSGRSPRGQLRVVSVPIRSDTPSLPKDQCWPWFLDVADPHPFCGDIEWASTVGVVGGFPDGTYRPTLPVSRQAFAAMLWRIAGSPPGPFANPGYVDVSAADPFFTPIAWAAATGVAAGYLDGSFRPTGAVTRSAAAAMLWRRAGSPPGPFPDPGYTDVAATHTFRLPIAWATATRLASGYLDGSFGAAAPVSRQTAAALLHSGAATG